jgi:hypothetical protein
MAVRVADYSKTFLSTTDSYDISHHGSPMYEAYQTISEEDRKLRDDLDKKFSFYNKNEGYDEMTKVPRRTSFGFDGKQIYIFKINGGPETSSTNPKKRTKYHVNISVVKAGDSHIIQNLSDLELRLIDEDFKAR